MVQPWAKTRQAMIKRVTRTIIWSIRCLMKPGTECWQRNKSVRMRGSRNRGKVAGRLQIKVARRVASRIANRRLKMKT